MNFRTIQFEIDEDMVVRVTLNAPEKHNALNPDMMHELVAVFESIGANEAVRAVVLTGEGVSFCAGADLKWMQSNLDKPRTERIVESQVLSVLFERIDQCPKLVIARVNGAAYGGGIGLIAACDIAIGVKSACFALTEVKLGLVPANIAPYVLRKIGVANLRRTALNGTRFDGIQAHSLGLLDVVVSADELNKSVASELKLALEAAPGAISRTKQMLAELHSGELQNSAGHLIEILADTWEGDEAQSGIRAFFDKKPPPWKPE